MAKRAAKSAKAAKPDKAGQPDKPTKTGSMRPVLLAAGLGLYWFVQFQGTGGLTDAPGWSGMIVLAARLLADFVGAWCVISALQLACALGRLGTGYLRSLWSGGSG